MDTGNTSSVDNNKEASAKKDDVPPTEKDELKKSMDKEDNNEITEDKNKTDECVIMVGTTGAGKTTNLNIFTGNELETGVSAQSVTDQTVAVTDKMHPEGPKWIDAPGWSDTE